MWKGRISVPLSTVVLIRTSLQRGGARPPPLWPWNQPFRHYSCLSGLDNRRHRDICRSRTSCCSFRTRVRGRPDPGLPRLLVSVRRRSRPCRRRTLRRSTWAESRTRWPPSVMFCVSIQAHLSAFSLPDASFQPSWFAEEVVRVGDSFRVLVPDHDAEAVEDPVAERVARRVDEVLAAPVACRARASPCSGRNERRTGSGTGCRDRRCSLSACGSRNRRADRSRPVAAASG